MRSLVKTDDRENMDGNREDNDRSREQWISTVKLWLFVVAMFGTVILLGFLGF